MGVSLDVEHSAQVNSLDDHSILTTISWKTQLKAPHNAANAEENLLCSDKVLVKNDIWLKLYNLMFHPKYLTT